MSTTSPSPRTRNLGGSLLGETLVGTSLVLLGLWLVYLALFRNLADSLTSVRATDHGLPLVFAAWLAALAAPLVLVLLGTDRLARLLATTRRSGWRRSSTDPYRNLPSGVVRVGRMALDDGRAAPSILIGAFGLVVVQETQGLGAQAEVSLTGGRLAAWDDPRENAGREAERVRRWISQHDHDFVVRVYAVLVTPESWIVRTNSCSVVTPDGLGEWIDALPRQRSFSPERQARLASMLGPVPVKGRRRVAA
jgi:hypothetical protein